MTIDELIEKIGIIQDLILELPDNDQTDIAWMALAKFYNELKKVQS